MDNSKKVSILIPTYNREKIVLETLNSAVNQTYKNIEVVVVDNKSTDNSFSIIKEFARSNPKVKAYQNEENVGPVKNWKKCLDYATGKYAKILWSDDLIAPDFIEKTLPYLMDNQDVGFVFTGTEVFSDDTGEKNKAYFIGDTGIYDTGTYIESALLGTPLPVPVSPGNAIFRKKDIEKNLLLNIPNKIGSDFAMHAIGNDVLIYLLTSLSYAKFAFVNETLASFRAHDDSITLSSNNMKLSILYHIAKAYFVENYVDDINLIKKFNTILLTISLRNIFMGKYGGITNVKDFYLKGNNISINGVCFLSLLIKRLFKITK